MITIIKKSNAIIPYRYRRDITVQNNETTDLTDYQICIEISDADFFTKADPNNLIIKDGSVVFPYWVETWIRSDGIARIWTKVSLPASSSKTLQLYYGGITDTQQDGDSVFEFFDDFDGSELDTNKWNTSYDIFNTGKDVTFSVQNSLLFATINADDNECIIANNSIQGDYRLKAKGGFKTSQYNSQHGIIFCYNRVNAPGDMFYWVKYTTTNNYFILRKDDASADPPILDYKNLNTQYNVTEVKKIGSDFYCINEWGVSLHGIDSDYTNNDAVGLFFAYDIGTVVWFDYFLVTKLTQNEPTVSVSGEVPS